jgi:hypothetical protein
MKDLAPIYSDFEDRIRALVNELDLDDPVQAEIFDHLVKAHWVAYKAAYPEMFTAEEYHV